MSFNHSVTVETLNGRESTTIRSNLNIFTWTRQDGGLTVRSGENTVRFHKSRRPRIVKVKRRDN